MTEPRDPRDPERPAEPAVPADPHDPGRPAEPTVAASSAVPADAADEPAHEPASGASAPDDTAWFDASDLFAGLDTAPRAGKRSTAEDTGSSSHPRRPRSPLVRSLHEHTSTLLWVIAALSAVAAALSPARPVGARAADALWCALLGAAVPLIASRARRVPLVWMGGVAAVVGIGGGTIGKVSAVATLVVLALVAFSDQRDRLTAALLGAVAVQALLRGPSYGFVGLPTLVGLAAILPVVVSGWRMARSAERTVAGRVVAVAVVLVGLASVGAFAAAMVTYSPLRAAKDDATSGLNLVRGGDTPAATVSFDAAAQQFGDANTTLEGPLGWVGRYVPVVGQHLESLRRVSAAGRDLTESAAITASSADWRDLTADGGVVDLDVVVALQQPVADSAAAITGALDAVADVRSPWLVSLVDDELVRFDDELADLAEQTELAAQGLAVAPALLGADETQRYFLAFSTPTESRDSGGFVGAYGILETRAGELDLVENGNIARIYPRTVGRSVYDFEPPVDWDERYGTYMVERNVGNMGASPDWPTGTEVIGQLYPQSLNGTPLDGALYADPAALAGFLELTGPVTLEDYDITLTAENAEQFLLVDQYVKFDGNSLERRELLADAGQATFDALTSRSLPGIATLTRVLGPLVADGHLRISVFDPEPEAYLDRVGLSGRWSVPDGSDYLSVRSANLLTNKIDSFLHRDITVDTAVDPDTGELTSTITVVLRNDAPDDGLPRYIIGNGEGLPWGTNRHLMAVHSPHRLESVTLDGEAWGVEIQTEFDGPVYSVPVDLPPGATRTVVLELAGAVPAWPYRLTVLPQPTANPDVMTLRVAGVDDLGPAPQLSGPLGPIVHLGPAQPGQ